MSIQNHNLNLPLNQIDVKDFDLQIILSICEKKVYKIELSPSLLQFLKLFTPTRKMVLNVRRRPPLYDQESCPKLYEDDRKNGRK